MTIHLPKATARISVTGRAKANMVFRPLARANIVLFVRGKVSGTPRVAVVEALNSRKVRITFDQQMALNSLLLAAGNYVVTPGEAGAIGVVVESVTPEPNVPFPLYVDLGVSEMTDGKDYDLEVHAGTGAPQSKLGLPINPNANTAGFTGKGLAPFIFNVRAVGLNRADVVFSESMLDNAAIRVPDRYEFDNGLVVTAVLGVIGDTVQLVTTDQVPGLVYNLTITAPEA